MYYFLGKTWLLLAVMLQQDVLNVKTQTLLLKKKKDPGSTIMSIIMTFPPQILNQ